MMSFSQVSQNNARDFAHDWDYIMVFPMMGVGQTPFKADQPSEPSTECDTICRTMLDAGLQLFLYESVQKDEVFVLIRCPYDKLCKFADTINFPLQLDERFAEECMVKGNPENKQKPVRINSDKKFSHYHPYQYSKCNIE